MPGLRPLTTLVYAGRPASRLAVLPDTTHYDVAASPHLAPLAEGFFG